MDKKLTRIRKRIQNKTTINMGILLSSLILFNFLVFYILINYNEVIFNNMQYLFILIITTLSINVIISTQSSMKKYNKELKKYIEIEKIFLNNNNIFYFDRKENKLIMINKNDFGYWEGYFLNAEKKIKIPIEKCIIK